MMHFGRLIDLALLDIHVSISLLAVLVLCCAPTDLSSWSDILNDLRHISSGSNPPGAVPSLTGKNSYTTDWIPELLSRYGSGRIDSDALAAAGLPAAAATGAAAGGSVEAGQGGTAGDKQQAEGQPGSSAAAAAGGVSGGGGVGEQGAAGADAGDRGARRGKRLRSKTGQAPTAAQQQEWQVGGCQPRSLRRCVNHVMRISTYSHLPKNT